MAEAHDGRIHQNRRFQRHPHKASSRWVETRSGDQIFANQRRSTLIPQDAKLTPWPDEFKKSYTLMADEPKLFERQAEVYAPCTDAEISRVIRSIEAILRGSRT